MNTLLPQAFIDKVAKLLPSEQELHAFVSICHQSLRKSIRVNQLKISVSAFCDRMQAQGWQLTPIPWCEAGFWLSRPPEQENTPLGNTAEHLAGLFYIQEASSMLPPVALFAQLDAPERVLDMAAAPGSKTTQISALMNNQGILVANELSSSRLKVLSATIQRLGAANIAMSHFDGEVFGQWLPDTFDAILLDAPCGGEGTVRKDPQAMQNWSEQALQDISAIQKRLIDSAFQALKPGGTLVYSTCTLSPEENQQVVQWLLEQYGDAVSVESLADLFAGAEQVVTAEGYLHVWPQRFDSEGFFVARLRKNYSAGESINHKKAGNFPYQPASAKQQTLLCDYLYHQFAITLPDGFRLYVRDKDYWLFPDAFTELIGRFRFDRIGVKLATAHKQGFRLSHEAALALTLTDNSPRVNLNLAQLSEFYQGRDLFLEQIPQGELLVCLDGFVVGLGKGIGQKLKNSLPRELVRDGLSL
ncbi:16S rRNA (cytosine(1407)-C(5))-methyltransferase RsmF [Bowmanella denitrificans]|uniref:Ribosomal RNA small subunit methyltransferase F n=1 Tax=Bowmanella denitrificans TaxID=366582 RepID=A0ABN0WUL1_9ALTE